ncbi:hypothetical protein [Methylobacterium soli]|uniref:Uncharacterized protein n=1 Tax=Methylobacterium soli TaxID=553447 RepID=A0A6L3SVS2_9HYPH|nr:hypothetical protein [Methylobacterium soli]KAB1077856.1 hypothetical protein F6X53_16705 [Methylobacterium soli]GJE42625.1 hypothetical protein AEGHOMDF_1797 [Methylobacterium soli]
MRTIREARSGDAWLRLLQTKAGFTGVVFIEDKRRFTIEGDTADKVWQLLQDEAAKLNPSYFGFSGARARFLRMMPDGFADPVYLAEERAYKLRAKERLDAALPLDAALAWNGDGKAALAAFRATNLLSPFESTRIGEALRSSAAAPYIRGAAAFASGAVEDGIRAMQGALKPFAIAKWTALTYLPFLWRPDAHLFLKPEVTREFAERVGHPFAHAYAPELHPDIYRSLLDLAAAMRTETADLQPADMIDVQSFIWVVGRYTEADEAAVLAKAVVTKSGTP